ncbi:MAG: elongation factor Ts [Gammaproteobacteria bacterium]|nr:elongation factor Ts [Gammaproteobacteria bacterium]
MSVSAAQVKELRERTGAGMMECKKALQEAGNIEAAIEFLRKSGRAKADKKAGRIAAEGTVIARTNEDGKQAILIEVNSETDFVARDQNFLTFANALANTALAANNQDIATLNHLPLVDHNVTVEEARQALVAKVGENINIRRISLAHSDNKVATYIHGGRIGVLVTLDSDQPELARDVAMHIAACKPLVISPEQVPAELVAKEKEIFVAQAANSGKSPDIIEKMVSGRIKKYLDEISLLGQPFVRDPNTTVGALLNKNRAKVLSFTRFEVGEGIEKEAEDFVEAVMSQVQNS